MLDELKCNENNLITCLVETLNSESFINTKKENEPEGAWVIFATRKKDNQRLAYEVGHSKDIYKELNKNILKMFKKEKNVQRGFFSNEVAYEWLDKIDCKYHTLTQDYEDIKIYKINISEFLKYESTNGPLTKIDISVVSKVVLAEILFAYESNAICWNPGPKSSYLESQLEDSEMQIAIQLKQLDTI